MYVLDHVLCFVFVVYAKLGLVASSAQYIVMWQLAPSMWIVDYFADYSIVPIILLFWCSSSGCRLSPFLMAPSFLASPSGRLVVLRPGSCLRRRWRLAAAPAIGLVAGDNLTVPLRCACPSLPQFAVVVAAALDAGHDMACTRGEK
uniref:Uncharacterized protein n=1 Tax=Oryza nivara TaxID=4536 RepID=A0A0E0GXY3_ORYNI